MLRGKSLSYAIYRRSAGLPTARLLEKPVKSSLKLTI
jgi:hypothetical protein